MKRERGKINDEWEKKEKEEERKMEVYRVMYDMSYIYIYINIVKKMRYISQ